MHKALLSSMKPMPPISAGEIEDIIGVLGGGLAGVQQGEIEVQILDIVENLIPFLEGLAIDRPNVTKSPIPQGSHHMPADKSSGSRHQDEIILLHQSFRHAANVPEELDISGAPLDRRTKIGNLPARTPQSRR